VVQGSAVASDQRPLQLGELFNERGERVRLAGAFRVMTEPTPRQTPSLAAGPGTATTARTSASPGSPGEGTAGEPPRAPGSRLLPATSGR
jgi:hypothetical protein